MQSFFNSLAFYYVFLFESSFPAHFYELYFFFFLMKVSLKIIKWMVVYKVEAFFSSFISVNNFWS